MTSSGASYERHYSQSNVILSYNPLKKFLRAEKINSTHYIICGTEYYSSPYRFVCKYLKYGVNYADVLSTPSGYIPLNGNPIHS